MAERPHLTLVYDSGDLPPRRRRVELKPQRIHVRTESNGLGAGVVVAFDQPGLLAVWAGQPADAGELGQALIEKAQAAGWRP